jgi:hypothetical protein
MPNLDALLAYTNGLHAGERVDVGVVHGNGTHSVLPLTLSAAPSNACWTVSIQDRRPRVHALESVVQIIDLLSGYVIVAVYEAHDLVAKALEPRGRLKDRDHLLGCVLWPEHLGRLPPASAELVGTPDVLGDLIQEGL